LGAEIVYATMGNPAITIGSSINVASAAWARISTPSGGATYFEEILHTRQFEAWGIPGFGSAYIVAAAVAEHDTGDAHNNIYENQAITLSVDLLKAYNNLPDNKKCPD